jgi:hypothetical protein
VDIIAFLWIAGGVAISVLLPVLGAFIRQAFRPTAGVIPYSVKKWGALFLFSTLTGILILAFYRSSHPDPIPWYTALLIGYTWDSTVQKITGATGG